MDKHAIWGDCGNFQPQTITNRINYGTTESDGPTAKIIIIDNHSTDGTKAELQTADILANPSVDYRYLTKNIGGAGGFARGMQIAAADPNLDWVSMSDDDAIFEPDYFEKTNCLSAKSSKSPNLDGECVY